MNKVMLLGNLTRDPEIRHTSGNTAVCNFGVACNRRWSTPEGEKREEVAFVDCEAWNKTGENISKFFAKGRKILVEGRLKLDQWEKEGQKFSKLKVVVEQFYFPESKGDSDDAPAQQQQSRSSSTSRSGGYSRGRSAAPAQQSGPEEDDIPF